MPKASFESENEKRRRKIKKGNIVISHQQVSHLNNI